MVFAFGHLVGAWLAGKGYELLSKKKINRYAWFFLLFGGLLPDIDFLLDWTFTNEIHRTVTHSLFFLILIPLLIYISLILMKEKDKSLAGFLFLGIAVHLFLDVLRSPGIPLLWPSLLHISFSSVSYLDPTQMSLFYPDPIMLKKSIQFAVFDMAIGTAWIFYLWFRKRIKF